jgi:DNA-binding transcriptional LysR family regulator
MDVDLRKLRYFVAVAEELNFGRAADRLHIAQPVLSRQVRALEAELGANLLVRDKRHTELTPAGVQLLADARPLLIAADGLRERVGRAARRPDAFTVGFMPGLIVTEPVRLLGRAHPDLHVEVIRTSWDDQVSSLHAGRVDIGYVRLPIDDHGLSVRQLFAEPAMVVLPNSHPLAGNESLGLGDLADEHLLQDPDAIPQWRQVAAEMRGRSVTPRIPALRTVEEKLEHVAAGQGICILPESTASYYQRSDVTRIPLTDVGPGAVGIAWVATNRNPLVAEFAALALASSPPMASLPAGG